MAKADKEKRLKMAKDLVGKGIGRNEAARQIAKRFKISLDSAKGDVRAACGPADGPSSTASMKTKRPAKEPEAAPPEVKEAEKGAAVDADAAGEPMVLAMLADLQRGKMPSIEKINEMTLMRLLVTMLSAPYEKDRIAAARAVTKMCGLDSPEFRKWQREKSKAFDPESRRLEILQALGLGRKA